jgi:hypothetical protein
VNESTEKEEKNKVRGKGYIKENKGFCTTRGEPQGRKKMLCGSPLFIGVEFRGNLSLYPFFCLYFVMVPECGQGTD